jgi:hypothetical protein
VEDQGAGGAAHRVEYEVPVPRPEGAQVEHLDLDALAGQGLGRFERPRDPDPEGDDGGVPARAGDPSLPERRRVVAGGHRPAGVAVQPLVLQEQHRVAVVEAGAADVREMADFIVEREIRAIFLETAVPPQGIEAVKEAVHARGFDVIIGGELYGDALGEEGTEQGTYIGAFRHNVDTIVDALLGGSAGPDGEVDDDDADDEDSYS